MAGSKAVAYSRYAPLCGAPGVIRTPDLLVRSQKSLCSPIASRSFCISFRYIMKHESHYEALIDGVIDGVDACNRRAQRAALLGVGRQW
jgi:hypothetical protein